MIFRGAGMAAVLLASQPGPGTAGTEGGRNETAARCDRAARRAAAEIGVPVGVLRAIALTETGRRHGGRLRPWPWAVNREGKGHWFASEAEARAFAEQSLAESRPSFDVGCFQINYRWHGAAFASLDAMFDPLTNARYAARFLKSLEAGSGDWSAAAGAYHSRTPAFARTYRTVFDRHLADLRGRSTPPPAAPMTTAPVAAPRAVPRPPRPRHIPLIALYGGGARPSPLPLRPGDGATMPGSLMPIQTGAARPLFDRDGGRG